jgi:hypothetical protein
MSCPLMDPWSRSVVEPKPYRVRTALLAEAHTPPLDPALAGGDSNHSNTTSCMYTVGMAPLLHHTVAPGTWATHTQCTLEVPCLRGQRPGSAHIQLLHLSHNGILQGPSCTIMSPSTAALVAAMLDVAWWEGSSQLRACWALLLPCCLSVGYARTLYSHASQCR